MSVTNAAVKIHFQAIENAKDSKIKEQRQYLQHGLFQASFFSCYITTYSSNML